MEIIWPNGVHDVILSNRSAQRIELNSIESIEQHELPCLHSYAKAWIEPLKEILLKHTPLLIVEPGRTLLMPPYGVQLTSETVIDISHESLMRIWIRLKTWLDEEAKSAEMYQKIAEAGERYQLGRAGLWKMPDLQLALNWQEETKPTIVWGQRYNTAYERTMVFLETSTRAYETEQRNKEFLQKRAIRNSRIFALSMAAAALVAIFFVVLAQIKADEADRAAEAALVAQAEAQANAEEATKNAEEAQRQTALAQEAQAETAEEAS